MTDVNSPVRVRYRVRLLILRLLEESSWTGSASGAKETASRKGGGRNRLRVPMIVVIIMN